MDPPWRGEGVEGLGLGSAEAREAQGRRGGGQRFTDLKAEGWTVLRGTHLLGGEQADVDEVPVVGHQGHHFKGQVGPWVLGSHRAGGNAGK